jgi:hypothetical protein
VKLSDIPSELVRQIADDAIGLFLEYRDRFGKDEEQAQALAVTEVVAGVDVDALQDEPLPGMES